MTRVQEHITYGEYVEVREKLEQLVVHISLRRCTNTREMMEGLVATMRAWDAIYMQHPEPRPAELQAKAVRHG